MMRIINIGIYPPPVGGVSTFIKRFKAYLDSINQQCCFVDISGVEVQQKRKRGIKCLSISQAFLWLMMQRKSILVFHSTKKLVLIGCLFLGLRHKIVILTHGEFFDGNDRRIIGWLLSKANLIIAPRKQLADKIIEYYPSCSRIVKYNPFIIYPRELPQINDEHILEMRKSAEVLLVAYVYDWVLLNGVDLYGIDMTIDLMHYLKTTDIDAKLILLAPNNNDCDYARAIDERIEKLDLRDEIYIHRERLDEAASLYALGDIYIRPSYIDGDSFSVLEALYVGVPVVASDAIDRPEGCVLFKNRDSEDFNNAVISVIQNLESYRKRVSELDINGSEKSLMRLVEAL